MPAAAEVTRDAILNSLEGSIKYLDNITIKDRLGATWFECGVSQISEASANSTSSSSGCRLHFVEAFELWLDIGSSGMPTNISNPFVRELFGAPKCNYEPTERQGSRLSYSDMFFTQPSGTQKWDRMYLGGAHRKQIQLKFRIYRLTIPQSEKRF
jgi:hypothetical protein